MKVLSVHNFYQQPGGEDSVFIDEAALLESYNHGVIRYTIHNDSVSHIHPIRLAGATIWNQASYNALTQLIQQEQPQVAHFHNTFPLVSPAAYYALKDEGVPVVQTLHNYRLLCPNAYFFRDGKVCEECLGKFIPLPAVQHACYRNNRFATVVVASMLTVHRTMQTWDNAVDLYIALTDFSRKKFIEGGLPADKIVTKPNFVYPDPLPGSGNGGYALFVGRLSPEKGIDTLLAAWKHLGNKLPLKIVGDGPLAKQVIEASKQSSNIEWLGRKSINEVHDLMGQASFLVFPSKWFETFGLVAIEAFAKGTPVIASNIGVIAELVENGRTGLHFHPGNAEDLAAKVEWAIEHPAELKNMRQAARTEFEAKYTPEANYQRIMEIYKQVLS